jgi:serine protease AprX
MLDKITLELYQQMNSLANSVNIPVIVRHKSGGFRAQALAAGLAATSRSFRFFPAEAMRVRAEEIEQLSRQGEVEQIWPDMRVQTCLDTSVSKIGVPKVWAEGHQGQGVKVAVLDTGIDYTHPDFAGRIAATKGFISYTARDGHGHGTHVAGIIAGSGAKSGGKYVGVAPAASLYIGKVLGDDGRGRMSHVMAGIEWAILEQQVQVINLSLSGTEAGNGTDALSTLCDEAVRQSNVVICVAAGNMGPTPQKIGSPGCARYVITVGAVDDQNRVAQFSSRGPTRDGRIKPDLVFPGVNIIAPRAASTRLGQPVEPGYARNNGTSMAAPHAAGVAALMLEANPHLTAEQVKTKMVAGKVHLGAQPNEQGAGRGDAYQAYRAATG